MIATNINVRESAEHMQRSSESRNAAGQRSFCCEHAVCEVERVLDIPKGLAEETGYAPHIVSLIKGMAEHGAAATDPIREFSSLLGEQWSVLLLLLLRDGPFRYSVLHRLVGVVTDAGPISQRILTLKMRGLERNGLVARKVTPSAPPRVDYQLTPLGERFLEQTGKFAEWVISETPNINTARRAFDRGDQFR